MKLRKLNHKDGPFMLEWMNDDGVVHYMGTDFTKKTLNDCYAFISSSQDDYPSIHRAIVADNDEYMGTVSLKNIDNENKNAEFAITVRRCAMGKGYSRYGMDEIIRFGFEQLGLKTIYWYVSKENTRAIRFYEKNGYEQVNYNEFQMGGTATGQLSVVCYTKISAASRMKDGMSSQIQLNTEYHFPFSAENRERA